MTYQFGLIGYPITHSLSPWIHEQFLERTKLQGEYSIIEISPEKSFSEEMERLRESNLNGFNITVPYKEKIIDYVDELDEQAEKIGAVNTVLCKNGRWIGYNTDGIGYMRALLQKYPQLTDRKDCQILLIGAGGAAKGIYYALLTNGYNHITIANRSLDKAIQLVGQNSESNVITLDEAEKTLKEFDVIIQTTSVGMKPDIEKSVIPITELKENAIVSDIVYQPLRTKFLHIAQSLGAHIHYGHTMLLYQAQYAFEIWTNEMPNMDGLDEELQKILEG